MAKLFPWDPWMELQSMKEDMNRLMEDSTCASPFQPSRLRTAQFRPVSDVIESSEDFQIHIELPGLTKNDVSLEVLENEVVVFGERKMLDVSGAAFHILERSYGCFARRFVLPVRIDGHGVRAVMKDGLLSVFIPKKPSPEPNKSVSIAVDE